MLWPSSHHITAAPSDSPEGTQDANRPPALKPFDTAATPIPPVVHPEGIQDEKAQDTGPK